MTVEQRIEKALINYLSKVHNIQSDFASFGLTHMERGWFEGCDTCGHGADEDTLSFYITFRNNDNSDGFIAVEGDPLQFLPTLFKYDEED